MANILIPTTAAVGGFIVGGPEGAALSYVLASSLTADDVSSPGAAAGDLSVQTSGYGQVIPLVSGRMKVQGGIFWADEKKTNTVTNRVGKGGGGGTETSTIIYTLSFAMFICKGPIVGVERMWKDGELIVDGTVGSPSVRNLPGTLYLGDNSQTADPVMEAVEGSGNVPGYRGMSYMVFEDFDLGTSGRVPFFRFQVLKEGAL